MIFVGPTAAHSHPLAQLIGLLSGHTFHGMENKTQDGAGHGQIHR